MRPTKKSPASPSKIRGSVGAESRRYFKKIGKSAEKRSKLLQCISLEDMPLEVRREEAKKPMYLIRYE